MNHDIGIVNRWMLDTLTITYTLFHRAVPDDEEGVASAVHLAVIEIATQVSAVREQGTAMSDDDLRRLFRAVIAKVIEVSGFTPTGIPSSPDNRPS